MVSAVLSHHEISSQERCSQRRFGFSFVTALALHLALFVGFINFSFNSESAQIMMPASQVINATLVMAPKVVAKPKAVKAPVPVQTPKPLVEKVSTLVPEPKPSLQAEPQPVVEPVLEPVAIQDQLTTNTVDEVFEESQPREVSMAEESYVPPSSNVAYYQNPKPRYPMAAKRRGMEGVVELRVMVDSSGKPVAIDLKQSSGFNVLDREATKAVWQWRFQPAKRAGMAVSGEVIVPVRYQLDKA